MDWPIVSSSLSNSPNKQNEKCGGCLMPSSRTIFRAHFFFGFPPPPSLLLACVFDPHCTSSWCFWLRRDRCLYHVLHSRPPYRLMLHLLQSCIANDMSHPVSSIYTHVYAHVFITIISISRYLPIQSTRYLTPTLPRLTRIE